MAKMAKLGSIKVVGDEAIARALRKAGIDVRQGTEMIVRAAATVFEDELRDRAPDSLADDVLQELTSKSQAKVTIDVGFRRRSSKIARFLEFGTKPHIIAVRKRSRGQAKALRLPGGVYRRKANHPGMSKRPFVRPTYEAKREEAQKEMGETVKRLSGAS